MKNAQIKFFKDENEKLRKTLRDCNADPKTKNKHGRKSLVEYKPKKTKHPKLGGYTVTSTEPKPLPKRTQQDIAQFFKKLYPKNPDVKLQN